MKFLIAGLGSIGRRHLRHLVKLGHKDVLLYRTNKSTLPDEALAHFQVETDLQRALDWEPDAVVVSNPTSLHLDVAIPAAQRGCHLLLEKPISHNLDRVDELKAAVEANNCKVLVGFQFRYHPGMEQVKAWLNEEKIGKVTSFRAHWGEYLPGWHPWEDYRQSYSALKELGGGVALTLCHPVDYLRWLLGDVASLWAFTRSDGLNLEVEDTVEAGFQMVSGAVGTMHLDYLQRPPRHSLEIIGTLGTILWENNSGFARLSNEGGDWIQSELPSEFSRGTLFARQMKHFLKILSNDELPICTLEDGIKTLQLIEAIKTSEDQKRMVVL